MQFITQVPRSLDLKPRIFGFELIDLLILFLYLTVSNVIFGQTSLKIPVVWGGAVAAASVLFFAKRGKPENYFRHLAQYHLAPSFYCAGLRDQRFLPFKTKEGRLEET